MADFTSVLFLDRRHGRPGAAGYPALTTGRPAAVAEPPTAALVARRVAQVQGAESGLVHRSALHGLVDVLSLAAGEGTAVFLDRGAYPLTATAARLAAGRGTPVVRFRHLDAGHLTRAVARSGRRPVVLTDGWCAGCNQPAPLADLRRVATAGGGLLVVDDTQAVGILGTHPGPGQPFGSGGGGSFAWSGADPEGVLRIASLAKGHGAPLAVTSGPARWMARLRDYGTRWHASPPTAADLAAAVTSTFDESGNERRRRRLAALVVRLRRGLAQQGLAVVGLPFPIVSVLIGPVRTALVLRDRLATRGVRAMVVQPDCRRGSLLSFAVTAAHTPADVDLVLVLLGRMAPEVAR
jgi:8-amino-7-oxononanoate synthase